MGVANLGSGFDFHFALEADLFFPLEVDFGFGFGF